MLQDINTRLSSSQAITSGTILSTDQFDLRPIARDIGIGEPLYVHVEVTETFNQLFTTMRVQVVCSPNTNLNDADAIVVSQSEDIAGAYLIDDAHFYVPIGNMSLSRALNVSFASIWPGVGTYLGCRYVVVGASPFTAGRVTTDIVRDIGPQGRLTVLGGAIPVHTYPAGY